MFRCSGVQVQVFRCSGVQVFRCSGAQVLRCSGVQVFTWKLMTPRLKKLRRLPSILDLVTLTIRHAACRGVRGFAAVSRAPPKKAMPSLM